MAFTFHIDDTSNPKAKAFLAFIKTLDFIRADDDKDFVLTNKHLELLEQRRNDRLEGKSTSYSWEEVKKSATTKMRKKASK